jgi:hypothetical protein
MGLQRILYFTYVKAVLNTLMVVCGFKHAGHFKLTPKEGTKTEEGSAASAVMSNSSPRSGSSKGDNGASLQKDKDSVDSPSSHLPIPRPGFRLTDVHSKLSKA